MYMMNMNSKTDMEMGRFTPAKPVIGGKRQGAKEQYQVFGPLSPLFFAQLPHTKPSTTMLLSRMMTYS